MRQTRWTGLVMAVGALVCLPVVADPPGPPTNYPPDLDLSAGVWQILNNGATLFNDAEGGLYFDFPVEEDTSCKPGCDNVNYLLTTHVPTSISGMIRVTLRVDSTGGTPEFQYTTNAACSPASVRAMIWSNDNDYSDGYRWWSNPIAYTLDAGYVTWNIPIDPAWWSGVFGQRANSSNQALHQWARAISDVSSLAVTFGGCFFGHGVFVTGGTARFTIQNYEVLPTPSCPNTARCIDNSCMQGAEVGDLNLGLHQCIDSSSAIAQCTYPETFHLISTQCSKFPCCSTKTGFPCICPIGDCPGGSYLECR